MPKTLQVRWSPAALREVDEIFNYLAAFNPKAAQEVADCLTEAAEGLVTFPHRGRSVPNSDMREAVTIYPCIIRYRVTGSTIRILRVRHTSRKPTTP